MIPLLVLLACGGAPGPDSEVDPPDVDTEESVERPSYAPLDPASLLVRASLDLRGVRPTLDELDRVTADPAAVDELIEGFLHDDRFGHRVAEIFAEVYQTRDEFPFVGLEFWETRFSKEQLHKSIGVEPLEVLAHIADNDLSYRELVTGDWTMANEILARLWPVEWTAGERGWRRTHYTDGRPAVGILASNGMWWQYGSMLNNLNRGRANQASRILLCADFLNNEIDFQSNQALNSEEALGEAIRTDPACAACHDTLDPLAAHFYGFWYYGFAKNSSGDIPYYHPEREQEWRRQGGLPPAFFGKPSSGLADLGELMADDDRFNRCFTRRSWEGLLRRPVESTEHILIEDHLATFEQSELNIRDLYADIVASEAYRNGEGERHLKLVSPGLLSTQMQDLTGFSWSIDGWDLMRAPLDGYFPLAGGADGIARTTSMREPSMTLLLVQERLAQAAASFAATRDAADPAHALLFTRLDFTETAQDAPALFEAQLQDLHKRIQSREATALELTEELDLWQAAYDRTGSTSGAWAVVTSLLLRDPDLLVY